MIIGHDMLTVLFVLIVVIQKEVSAELSARGTEIQNAEGNLGKVTLVCLHETNYMY